LLPLHAAGIYEGASKDQICVADYVVSSYTPSLSAIIRAREGFIAVHRHELRAAIYADSGVNGGHTHIPEVIKEVKTAAQILTSYLASVNLNENNASKAESMFEHASETHILHLACHGHQHENPLESSFALKHPLTISDLMKLDLKNAMLAYLSACETAKGDEKHLDQAVHLAASMLFCGFRSVVATMWSVCPKLEH
jgi:CHAT domain-containing protein